MTVMARNRGWAIVLTFLVAGLVGGCAPASTAGGVTGPAAAFDATPLDAPATIVIGLYPSITALPLYVARERGYFAAERLEVQVPLSKSSVDSMPLLATGRMDGFVSAPSPSFINSVHNGVEAKFVASFGNPRPGGPNSAFIAKKNGPITDVASLKGRRIAVGNGKADAAAFLLSELLKQGNLTIDDVQLVDIDLAESVTALENDSVDAAYVLGVTALDLQNAGTHLVVGDMDAVLVQGTGAGIIFGSRLLDRDTRVGAAFLLAVLRGAQDLQGDYMNDPQIVGILARAMKLPPEALSKQAPVAPVASTDMVIGTSFFERMQQYFVDAGVIPTGQAVSVGQAFDQRFVAAMRPTS
jgi:NitT/TauT family transport system substrate-binding protein